MHSNPKPNPNPKSASNCHLKWVVNRMYICLVDRVANYPQPSRDTTQNTHTLTRTHAHTHSHSLTHGERDSQTRWRCKGSDKSEPNVNYHKKCNVLGLWVAWVFDMNTSMNTAHEYWVANWTAAAAQLRCLSNRSRSSTSTSARAHSHSHSFGLTVAPIRACGIGA